MNGMHHKTVEDFKNKKVFRLITILTAKEQTQFERWLESEIGTKTNKVLILYQMILCKKDTKAIWKALYPSKRLPDSPFNEVVFRKLESQLSSYLEEFIAIKTFRKSRFTRDLFLIKALNERVAQVLFDNEIRRMRRKLESEPIKDCDFYRVKYELEKEYQIYINNYKLMGQDGITHSLNKTFDIWWLHEKLKLANNNLNHFIIKGEEVKTLFQKEIMHLNFEGEEYNTYPLVRIYHKLYLLLLNQEEPTHIKELIQEHRFKLNKEELKDIYTLMFNYYTRKANSTGENQYFHELLELFEWGIKDKLIFRNGLLSWSVYKNLITVCLRTRQYNLAYEYLNNYKKYLPEKDKNEAYQFNLAQYYFSQRQYHEVIKILTQRFSNLYYEIQGRLLLIKANYELKNDDSLEKSLRSLHVFISRQKTISKSRKTIEINYIKLFIKLLKAYHSEDYTKLLNNIEKTQPLNNKQWLLEKLKEKAKV